MTLPEFFCWSRYGTEAGQAVEEILTRKEEERRLNGGIFLWGIGSALGPSMTELLRLTNSPSVFFSPIVTRPSFEDAYPAAVVFWRRAQALTGEGVNLPSASLVTSRYDPLHPKRHHYALVCRSEQPIGVRQSFENINFFQLQNLLTGRPIGFSQVTAVVRIASQRASRSRSYEVSFSAQLIDPYFVRLSDPAPLPFDGDGVPWGSAVRREWESRIS